MLWGDEMDKEHVKGALDNVIGKTKEVAGHVTDNPDLEAEGKADQVKGALRNAAGDAKDAGREAIDRLKDASDKY